MGSERFGVAGRLTVRAQAHGGGEGLLQNEGQRAAHMSSARRVHSDLSLLSALSGEGTLGKENVFVTLRSRAVYSSLMMTWSSSSTSENASGT